MKLILAFCLSVAAVFLTVESSGGMLPPDVMIARFQGDRAAAVSLTFDDALVSHVETALTILDSYGLNGTFFLLISNIRDDWPSNWDVWRAAAANGHELGSHSITHPLLTHVQDPLRLKEELEGSADIIEENTGFRPVSFAYPESDVNDAVRRLVLNTYVFDRADCRVWGGQGFSAEDGIRHLEQAVVRKEWFYCMLHGVGENTWGPMEPFVFEELAKYLDQNRGQIWTDTYERVSSYVRKRNAAQVTVRDVKKNSFLFRVALPDQPDFKRLPDMPLTIKIAIDERPDEGARMRYRRGEDLPVTVSSCGYYLMTDIEPDGRWIEVGW